MSTLYENIKSLCDEKGVSGGKMCLDIGASKSLMTGLKMGRTKSINMDTAQKIADYFGVSVDRVLGAEQKEKSPTPEGVELNETQQMAWDLIQNMDEDKLKAFIAGAKAMLNN